jgi:hypothetical protein
MTRITTRLTNEAIQCLFEKGRVTVKDHAGNEASDRMLFNRVMRRLRFEHTYDMKFIAGDLNSLTITLDRNAKQ